MNTETVSAFEQKFDVLEQKIRLAIDRIEVLKQENKRLTEALEEAEGRIGRIDSELMKAQSAVLEAEGWKTQLQEFTNLKAQIAFKIENLLSLMESPPISEL